jgi:hypothetical protein
MTSPLTNKGGMRRVGLCSKETWPQMIAVHVKCKFGEMYSNISGNASPCAGPGGAIISVCAAQQLLVCALNGTRGTGKIACGTSEAPIKRFTQFPQPN